MKGADLIERAYEHARSGEHRNLSDVTKALKSDGFMRGLIEDHLGGKCIREELRKLCREAQSHRVYDYSGRETSASGRNV